MPETLDGFDGSDRPREPGTYVEKAVRRKLILVHGSGTLGEGMHDLAGHIDNEGYDVHVRAIPFEPVPLLGVLLWVRRRRVRDDLSKQLIEEIQQTPSRADLSVVAHSYGTYLLTWWLRDNPATNMRNLILLAPIVRRPEIAELTRLADRVLVDVMVDDKIPCIAQAFRPPHYEATGSFGVRGTKPLGIGTLNERFFSNAAQPRSWWFGALTWVGKIVFGKGHSAHLEKQHFIDNILPIVTDDRVPSSTEAGPALTQKTVHAIRWLAIGLLSVAAICLWKLLR